MTRYALTDDISELLGVPITERGQNAMLRCPFHEDDRPSLSIDLERGFWMCFGCSEKGTIFTLADKLSKVVDRDDIMDRSGRADQTPNEPPDFQDKAFELYQNLWFVKPDTVSRYIKARGISGKAVEKFQLGWDSPTGRIAMPYYDGDSVVAIKYRYQDGFKAYEPGSVHFLYNVNDAREPWAKIIIVCEGESDTHAVWSHVDSLMDSRYNCLSDYIAVVGVPGVGAGLPSRKTWELWSLEFMFAEKVYIAFDADDAGDAGADLVMSIIGSKSIRMRPTIGSDMADHLMKGGSLAEAGLDVEDL